MSPPTPSTPGITLSQHNNTNICHYVASNIKSPFSSLGIAVTMHELSPGISSPPTPSSSSSSPPGPVFSGQLGFIDFDTSTRLPRHVHIAPLSDAANAETARAGRPFLPTQHFTTERILVLNGTALVELNGQVYVIPPKTLVTIAPGVPHTWTACPAGVSMAKALAGRPSAGKDGSAETQTTVESVSDGTFLMVYEYEEVTGFFPTEQTETLRDVKDYVWCDDLERIRFPKLSAEEVYERGNFAWGKDVWRLDR